METQETQQEKECIVCSGKYELSVVANTCSSEYVCKKHIEEIITYLQNKLL